MRRYYAIIFFLAAALRFLCVPVFVIDDDEAWSSAASLAMKSPWQFYRSAVDHKPPGFIWFYWFVDHIVPCASDPRVIRAAYTILAILAAAVVGWMAARFARAKNREGAPEAAMDIASVGWCAAALFLLITALPAPKLLAVTADGLIADFVILGYAVALFSEFAFRPILSGILAEILAEILAGAVLALALLVKQTAVFFAIPILFARWPRNWAWKQIPLFLLGAAIVLVPCIFKLGVADFFYWNWTYPKEVLAAVRAQLFESNLEGFETFGFFVLAILPLAWVLVRRVMSRALKWTDFRVLWLLAGLCGFAIGKGLFLHYLLLIAAPVALLGAEALAHQSARRWRGRVFSWTGIQYVAGCLLLVIPSSGVFWGTDLVYFKALGRVMSASLRPGEKVMVWGGSALPLTYAKVAHVTRFVLPRFAVAPYATTKTRTIFHEELSQELPALILDLHERGDNQFDNPLSSERYVADLVHAKYKLYVSEPIPWAKFYFLNPPAPRAGLLAVNDDARLYEPFPIQRESWERLGELARTEGLRRAIEADWQLRAEISLALVARQALNDETRARADALAKQLGLSAGISPELRSEITDFMRGQALASDGVLPIPMISSSWWASVAMVELQPRARIPQP